MVEIWQLIEAAVPTSLLIALLTALFTVLLTLIFVTLLGGVLERLLYRPRLKIKFDEKLLGTATDALSGVVVVYNDGGNSANECIGAITIYNFDSKKTLDKSALDKVLLPEKQEQLPNEIKKIKEILVTSDKGRKIDGELLCWAHLGNPTKYTIYPGTKTLLDIFFAYKTKEEGWLLIIPSESGWSITRAILKDIDFTGELMVSPVNGKHVTQRFRIKSEGDKLTFEMLKWYSPIFGA